MGQAAVRKKNHKLAIEHLKRFGLEQDHPEAGQSESAAWLLRNFVTGLPEAADGGKQTWHNQVFLEGQRHLDPDVRRGMRAVMNSVLTAGLEPGRVVFALMADLELDRPEVVGEFDTCEAIAAWVCTQLNVPRHNLRIRYSAMCVPARGGLFGLLPTLKLITAAKPVGEQPKVATRKGSRDNQKRQTIMFLVSVFTNHALELDKLTPGGASPVFELPYWGFEDEQPVSVARVTPKYALQVFDALEMLGFWETFQEMEAGLASQLPYAKKAAKGSKPVLQVCVRHSLDARFSAGTEVFARWRDVEMLELPIYQGSFAEYFIAQLDRLPVQVDRVPGILPALPDVPLFAPGGDWEHLADDAGPEKGPRT
jgi:hypothetical protein